jgi:hypothetical protein
MSFKRLKGATGNLTDSSVHQGDSASSIKRRAILVHSGPEGEKVTFQSSDGEIAFDKARIENIVKSQNAMIEKMVAEYGGWEKTPIGAFPPILDQHSDDSNDRIRGRLSALLKFEVRDVPKVGKNVACAVTEITFIGEETVKQVLDGRIYHLSVGIDESTDTLGETSTVIDPAAAGAMLLSKGKRMATKKKLKEGSMKTTKLAASKKKMDIIKKLSSGMADLAKMVKSTNDDVKLAKRAGEVGSRLKKLMSSKKLSPAEFKKMDIKRLSKLDSEQFETVMNTFEAREDIIMAGQRGTKDAEGFGSMAKDLEKRQLSRLKKEIRGDLKRLGKKMKEDESEDKELAFGDDEQDEKKLAEEVSKDKKDMSDLSADVEDDSKNLSGDEIQEHDESSFQKLQSQVDELNTNLARMAGMVSELMKVEKDEGHDLEAGEQDGSESKELEEGSEEDEKELAEGEEIKDEKDEQGK